MNDEQTDTLALISAYTWKPLSDFPGVSVIHLSGVLDEDRKSGRRTRLVRFEPGARTPKPLVHDYHEEVFLVSGDVTGFAETQSFGTSTQSAYVHRPPGTLHGPLRSEGGCVMMEIHYFSDAR